MSTSPQFTEASTTEVSQTYRTIAVVLALIVIMGLGYGLVDTAIKAGALFTE
ncbi:hypothetical protein [Enteractinococcus helveticum]|uniref:hypothetical protein n=1 Tax=Enteractinococcus helveticum TaxID=1837282 RepID=UPI000B0344DD|nr:hypothetical protein [Enteractinococcus helveticum]